MLGFKFQSNDGWVVARSEAAVIAKAIEALLADDDAFELLMDILDVGRGAEKRAARGAVVVSEVQREVRSARGLHGVVTQGRRAARPSSAR